MLPTNMSRSSRNGPAAPPRRSSSRSPIPIEIQMNGVAHLTHLRSISLFGLSVVTLIFDDEIDNLLAGSRFSKNSRR